MQKLTTLFLWRTVVRLSTSSLSIKPHTMFSCSPRSSTALLYEATQIIQLRASVLILRLLGDIHVDGLHTQDGPKNRVPAPSSAGSTNSANEERPCLMRKYHIQDLGWRWKRISSLSSFTQSSAVIFAGSYIGFTLAYDTHLISPLTYDTRHISPLTYTLVRFVYDPNSASLKNRA